MELIIDGNKQLINVSNIGTFKHFYEKLSLGVSNEERVISEIAINGKVMEEGSQFEYFSKSMEEIDFVSIKTILKKTLIEENISGLKDHISNIVDNIDKSSDAFRMDDEFNSHKYFAAVIEGMRWFNYSINLIVSLKKIDFESFAFLDSTLSNQLDKLELTLNTLEDAQANKDNIAISDILEYELKEILLNWQENLDEFRK
ncbi:MAG: hypothetical protein CR982_01200 [Candidatus Cloacimonadota bacterium]|nr:MAG: hypothetical protein CR982_01200 [Candidatus Cloacimonadota bacterium]PIE81261.1 MAG: hypothetical protein CSA15_00980 [Candidatus Delongbacteria bacterium]